MIAFEVFNDGQKKCTAGVSDLGVMSVIAGPIPHHFEEGLTPTTTQGWTAVHAGHGEDGGSRLTVDRERTDPTWTERRMREYYERLKREYGEA
jgi:hypothetical protein